jgi:tetratricopeptide (TPR) repeat protein
LSHQRLLWPDGYQAHVLKQPWCYLLRTCGEYEQAMDGYGNQWQNYDNRDNLPPVFFQQLHQHAAPQPYPQTMGHQYQQGYPIHQTQPYQRQPARIEVVVPSRQQVHYAQPAAQQQTYQYNQQYNAGPLPQQQVHRPIPQVDGNANDQYMPAFVKLETPMTSHRVPSQIPAQAPAIPSAPPPNEMTMHAEEQGYDYAKVLLVLADEYLQAADTVPEDSEEHYKLISFGLGCIEATLKDFHLPPLREAQLSRRYAQILYEKTQNYEQAEKAIHKAIQLCDTNKYLDLKYSLLLLSIRILFETRPKAAIRLLQDSLEDMKLYKHVAWSYAFRFELAMLTLRSSVREIQSSIHHLEIVVETAQKNDDKAVSALAATMTALLHLQTPAADAASSAQQSVAVARSLQLDADVAALPQLQLMADFVDLCCCLRLSTGRDEKRKQMQETWGRITNDGVWKDAWSVSDPTLYVPIKQTSLRGCELQQGGLLLQRNQQSTLPLTWCTRSDAEAICFLLCAASMTHKSSSDWSKAEQFIQQGLERVRIADGDTIINRKMLECRFVIELGFLNCLKSNWAGAKNALTKAAQIFKTSPSSLPKSMGCAIQYLNGTIYQGIGNLERALAIWDGSVFDLSHFLRQSNASNTPSDGKQSTKTMQRHHDLDTEICRNLSILACINRLFIIDDASHPKHGQKAQLVALLSTFISQTHDRNISAAHTLAHSLITNSGICVSKSALVRVLNDAKAIANQQITALVLVVMQQVFFVGSTDDHAQKCLNAVSVQMKSWRSPIWLHVTEGIQAESLHFMGDLQQSAQKMEDAKKSWAMLPEGVKRSVRWDQPPPVKSVAKVDGDRLA